MFVSIREPNAQELEEVRAVEDEAAAADDDPREEDEKKQRADDVNVSPRNVIKIFDFWKIYSSFLAVSCISTYVGNYDKAYGQRYIQVSSMSQ